MRVFLLFAIAICLPATVLAQAYRWVDANGQVHYTQTPPPGSTSATVVAPPPPPSAAPNQDAIKKSLDQSIKEEPKKREDAAAALAAADKQQADCKNVRDQLAQLEIAGKPQRMATKDDNGTVTRWTPQQFEQQHQVFQQYLHDKCGG